MGFSSGLDAILSEAEPLARHTWFKVGGPARWFARPRTPADVSELVRRCRDHRLDHLVLGLGANLLVDDEGVDAVVTRLDAPHFTTVMFGDERSGDEVLVSAGAGADMAKFAWSTVKRGLRGLEVLAGIPGTVGGIIRMNAGGRFGCVADTVRDVSVIMPDGRLHTLTPAQVGFAYRHTGLTGAVVCGATFRLRRDDPARVQADYREIWSYKTQSQPLKYHSAGCVFKNPAGDSAGRLIDRAGLKGARQGGAYVSDHHANFIIADDGASAADVMALIGRIRREVHERFGTLLEMEVQVWGRCRPPEAEQAA